MELVKGKFNSIRDEILYSVSLDGFDEQTRDRFGVSYTLVSINMEDLPEIQRAMRQMYRSPSSEHYTACRECVGTFIIAEHADGFVTIFSYANSDLARVAWNEGTDSVSY